MACPATLLTTPGTQLKELTPPDREPLLTLEQVIEACRDLQLGIYLDVKDADDEAAALEVIALFEKYGMLQATVFGSFRADWMAALKELCPQAMTSILFGAQHLDPVMLARSLRADFVHPCWERFDRPQDLLTPEWLAAAREAGLGVMIWHEERPEVIRDLHQLGIYGICSDEPQLLLPEVSAGASP